MAESPADTRIRVDDMEIAAIRMARPDPLQFALESLGFASWSSVVALARSQHHPVAIELLARHVERSL